MIREVELNQIYLSRTGIKFKTMYRAKHAQDCSISNIIYTNLEDTLDTKAGEIWVLSESLFLKLFNENN